MKTDGSRRIAERYVRALFEVAQGNKALDQVEQDLTALAKALAESESFRHFLSNPLIPRDHQADAMIAIAAKMNAHQATRQFVAMLAQHRRLSILPEIVDIFRQWAANARGEMRAELIAASPLKPQELTLISERLGKVYGKKVNLDVREDPSLLGGVVVKVGGLQLDGSLAGKMRRLKNTLQAA